MKRAFVFLFLLVLLPRFGRTQSVTPEFELKINYSDAGGGGNSDPKGFGYDLSATDSLNSQFGEMPLPGAPSTDGYFFGFPVNDFEGDYTEVDILPKPTTDTFTIQYTLYISAYMYPATISWNRSQIPSAIKAITITPISEPNFILANMTTQSSVSITDNPSDSTYYSNWEPAIITLYYNTEPPSLGVSNSQQISVGLISNLAAFPNPMQSSGAIAFNLSQPASVIVTGYDALGRQVLSITKDESSGPNTIDLSSAIAAHSGAIMLRLDAANDMQHETGTVMMIKE